jgi:hypothetical protein
MHLFLRSVGFLGIDSKRQEEKFIKQAVRDAIASDSVCFDEKRQCGLIRVCCGDGFGILIKGSYHKTRKFQMEYYYPYLEAAGVTGCEEIIVERHADKDSYAIICDEVRAGVTLIFYLENILDYYKYMKPAQNSIMDRTVSLSAFSRNGCVLLPVLKSDSQIKKCEKETLVRNKLIAAARQGDEDAMESLTIEEMDTYNRISERIRREDVYSIVDTTFMPCGVECDQYSVIGTILECDLRSNIMTGEEVWVMVLECNDFTFRTIINKEDLFGEPQVGRRFKGKVWMCAHINFE